MTRIISVPLMAVALALVAACGGSSSSSGPTVTIDDNAGNGAGSNFSGAFQEPNLSQIRPGVEVAAAGSSCTSNFLYYLNDETVYLGAAAHCFSVDANTGVDPCEATSLPVGSPVFIENAENPGTLAYSSWSAMQQAGENPGSSACLYNDFALIRLHREDIANIHPAVFAYGGPSSLARGVARVGDTVYAYGRSMFHLAIEELETRRGTITGVFGGGWLYDVVNDLPGLGVPGDSGGPVLDASGRALAVTSLLTFSTSENPVTNGVVNLDMALDYAKEEGFINRGVALLTWSKFNSAPGVLGMLGL